MDKQTLFDADVVKNECNLWSKVMIQDPMFQHFCLVSSLGLVVETFT